MPLHGLIDIQRVYARRIKASEPHIAHDHHFERVVRRLETLLQVFLHLPAIDMRAQQCLITGRTRHDDLDRALLRVRVMPLGSQLDDLVIKVDANLAAHGDHHGLAVLCLLPFFKVSHQVRSHAGNTRLCTHHLFQRGPLRLQLGLITFFLILGQLINILI